MMQRNNRHEKRAKLSDARRAAVRDGWGPWSRRFFSAEEMRGLGTRLGPRDTAVNNVYSVQITEHRTSWGLVLHLWIRRHDEQPIRQWADLQRIKDELVGPERTAIEVFPARSRLVDDANMYHLWVLEEGREPPFGLHLGEPDPARARFADALRSFCREFEAPR